MQPIDTGLNLKSEAGDIMDADKNLKAHSYTIQLTDDETGLFVSKKLHIYSDSPKDLVNCILRSTIETMKELGITNEERPRS